MLSPTSADVQEGGTFWVIPQKGIKPSLTLLIPHSWTGRVCFVAQKKLDICFHALSFTTIEPCWIPQIKFPTSSAMPGWHVEYSSSNKWWYSIQREMTIRSFLINCKKLFWNYQQSQIIYLHTSSFFMKISIDIVIWVTNTRIWKLIYWKNTPNYV